jgi:hypothetical protein
MGAASAMLMLAEHVASKAARDAFFLTSFGVEALPTMFIVAAVTSIAVVPAMARVLSRWGPARVVPPAFATSAVLVAGSAWLAGAFPRAAAVTVYLHVAAINAVLISWFWSLVNERFDPRTAKLAMRRMVGGAALGGLVGGLVAERAAVWLGPRSMLLVLAAMHVACAAATYRLGAGARAGARVAPSASGFAVLRRSSYAQKLALLVVASTVAAALIDYAFKAQAVATYHKGPTLLRFFALYYAGTGIATFLLQSLLSRLALAKLGIARTVATLPAAVALGGVAALFAPALGTFTALRAAESSLHSSLYRSGYELFFTPMSPADKRGIKTLIDVGFDRLGDALGGGLLKLVLAVAGAYAITTMLGLAIGLSVLVVIVAARLQRGYVRTLENRLRDRAGEIDLPDMRDSTTMSVLMSLDRGPAAVAAAAPAPAPPRPSTQVDPLLERIAALRSREPDRVKRALAEGPLTAALVPHAIALLAWDEAAAWAIAALGRVADGFAGQLTDALLAADEEFAIRRRVPRALETASSPRAIEGLLAGLDDSRFEVRYRCGRALARIHARAPEAAVERDRIFRAVLREAAIDRGVWESQRLLDEDPGDGGDAFVDELLRERASRSLEHVFTLLSLAFPRKPLVLAFRGLHTNDAQLRGTALEYLEGVLPADVRTALWPFLEDRRPPVPAPARPREQVLDELLLSNRSIQLNLEELRRRVKL